MVKNLSAMQETQVCSLGWEDPLEKGLATPWTENLVGYSPRYHKELDRTELLTQQQ